MLDNKGLRTTVGRGLKKYLGIPFVQLNQDGEQPKYPFLGYTVTTPKSANNGTWGEYEDGKARIPVTQTWSVTAFADNEEDSVEIADKAHAWLSYIGARYLADNNVIVQKVTNVTNRDNVLSVGYEYKNGFDCVFWMLDETESYTETAEVIEEVEFGDIANSSTPSN